MPPAPRAPGARLVLACALLLASVARADPGPILEYVTVEANEAGASGGHAALRLDEHVFHFQAEQGRLQLAREAWPAFRFRYRVIENRALHAIRIAVSPGVAERLSRHFDRLWWLESAERARVSALGEDVRLLEALARAKRAKEASAVLPGMSFFALGEAPPETAHAAGVVAIRGLRERIARAHGSDFARRRLEQAEASLRAMLPGPASTAPTDPAAVTQPTLSQRTREALAVRGALRVLRDGPPLRDDACVELPGETATLAPAERRALRARHDALETELVRLVASQRPDWGFAFALGQARLAALAESLDAGRLVVLDAIPADAPRLDAATVARAKEPLQRRLRRRSADLVAARRALTADRAREADLARLEQAASRYAELARALAEGGGLRLALGARAPRGRSSGHEVPLPELAAAELDAPLAAARDRLRAAQRSLAQRTEYDLLANNCVTAIFREVDAALGAPPALGQGPPALSSRAEDGVLGALRFVPFVSAHLVRRGGPVAAERTLPSYRNERIAALLARESRWRVALRESNAFTATTYEAHAADSHFVFFTDRSPWSRPVLGSVNVAAGFLHSAAGLLRLPWDRGRSLSRGARGLAASLPELVFVNIRKGSYPFADPPTAASGG